MTKAEIIEAVYKKIGVSKKDASQLVESVFTIIKQSLASGEKVKVSGFGNFMIQNKNSRVGRNPQTGKSIEISARRRVAFRPSQVLKDDLNKNAASGAGLGTDVSR
jgi:integration host factor subunit alpha